jgi:flagellar protein FliS
MNKGGSSGNGSRRYSSPEDKTMPPPGSALRAYRNSEVATLSQRDMIVRLYQGMERFLVQAQMAMNNRQPAEAHDYCQRIKGILVELISTLNFDKGGEVAQRLHSLYVFFLSTVMEANLRKDATKLAQILPIIADLRSAWERIPDDLANTSSVPAGNEGHTLNLRT